ncbi:hypothetical protein BCR32DRAFT_283456 [Anaeromyces robustus]|uniref:Uncharacterized protein n=1 Tax=Anaeromyces robustus TaxID=1754192 RepID=A0A1Y1WUE4_9FUNG|nr:hypothetical protein BCR32DRAFT_283456 [Anaeromyces robustus]|eukprot:ORX77169.1 hypothetical protein BCR32DRAFT_283456 [Anaeromyces robustus]
MDDFGYNNEDKVVKHCRRIFDGKYNQYWIDTLDKEDNEVQNKLKYVRVNLYPKNINLREELIMRGITPPKKLTIRQPHKPKRDRYIQQEQYEEALSNYRIKKRRYDEAVEANRKEWSKYKSIVYELIHEDIDYEKCVNHTTPIRLEIIQVRKSKKSPKYIVKTL